VVRDWRKLDNEELHNLNSSPNIIKVIKSRRISWIGYIAHMVEIRCIQNFGQEMKGRDHTDGINGKIILEWILEK